MSHQHPFWSRLGCCSTICHSPTAPPLPPRVTELVRRATGLAPNPSLQVLVLELSCEGEEEDTAFPPLHLEL